MDRPSLNRTVHRGAAQDSKVVTCRDPRNKDRTVRNDAAQRKVCCPKLG
jgi:hypothetical protein